VYARWTVYLSAVDFRTTTQPGAGNDGVSRIIDVQCVDVGGTTGGSALPASCTTDTDGDGLVDEVEAWFGTDAGLADTDGDGSNDFSEMALGTRPSTTSLGFDADCDPQPASGSEPAIDSTFSNAADTDCDGQRDVQDNGADQTTGSKGTIEDTDIDDNCPTNYNPSQINSDSPRFAPNPQPVNNDASDPTSDLTGDACDGDDDNDSADDVVELDLAINPTPAAGESYCSTVTAGEPGYVANATSPTDDDDDDDGGLTGVECRHLVNPTSSAAAQRMPDSFAAVGAADQTAQEIFYRTQGINNPAGAGEIDDLDGDGSNGVADSDSDTHPSSTGADGALDTREVKFYGTRASSDDTDGDGCGDGREMADVTGNKNIDVLDLSQIAAVSGSIRNGAGMLDQTKVNRDMTRNGVIDVLDLGFAAARSGVCPAQGGIEINQGNSPQP
jgi:hypothetical protein